MRDEFTDQDFESASAERQMTKRKCTRQELERFFICMAADSVLLHAVWEMAQMPAYKDLAGRPLPETAVRCAPATLGDIAITFWIYAIVALAAHSLSWGLQPRWNVYLTVALLGAMHAFWIERAAIASGRWSYTAAMPIIPPLGVGLWPLLQLLVLTPLTIGLSSLLALRKRNRATQRASDSANP